jgi:hypothetical protein
MRTVQKAMELTLNRVYNCVFLETSHGFRPNKSCHIALKSIDEKAKGVAWFIEADITKCFDSIPHQLLLDALGKLSGCTMLQARQHLDNNPIIMLTMNASKPQLRPRRRCSSSHGHMIFTLPIGPKRPNTQNLLAENAQ